MLIKLYKEENMFRLDEHAEGFSVIQCLFLIPKEKNMDYYYL